jgi:hypothetical protein
MVRISRKFDPGFQDLLKKHASVDHNTGKLTFDGVYVKPVLNIGWKGKQIPVPYSHIVWLLVHGEWPKDGFQLDHINDDPLDNRPANLEEKTAVENQKKRRGRMVYRSYGKGKYGYGINVDHDKRDDRYYIRRHLSRGHGSGELKTIRKALGGFDTLQEAEAKVVEYIALIDKHGLDYVPPPPPKRQSKSSARLEFMTRRIRRLRKEGKTIQELAKLTGFSESSIHNVTKDLHVDNRLKS